MRLALLFLLAVCMVACDEDTSGVVESTRPTLDVPFSTIPVTQQDVRELVMATNANGIKAEIIGIAENALLLLDIDATRVEPVLLGQPNKGVSAQNAMLENNFIAVIGSGFVSELHTLEPVGLLQVNGKTLSPVQGHGYTRILGINDAGMGVVHRESYQRELFYSALQAGPGIIEQGKLDISERDLQRPKYFRSFIAICDNRWLAGVSLAPTHLRTLGQTLLQHIEKQGLQCGDVVNLAGDREAVLMFQADDKTVVYHGNPTTYKVSLVGFRLKAT